MVENQYLDAVVEIVAGLLAGGVDSKETRIGEGKGEGLGRLGPPVLVEDTGVKARVHA